MIGVFFHHNNFYKLGLVIIFMGYPVSFGKYEGTSLEQIALGKSCPHGGGKAEGYYYFNQLAKGDPKYFSKFQNNSFAMQRWDEIHTKLNLFKSPYKCAVCNTKTPTKLSIAGSGEYGYSMGRNYITCDDEPCRQAMASMPGSGTRFCNLGFDTILEFGWASGNRKFDEQMLADLLKNLAGWPAGQKLTDKACTQFIDSITLR